MQPDFSSPEFQRAMLCTVRFGGEGRSIGNNYRCDLCFDDAETEPVAAVRVYFVGCQRVDSLEAVPAVIAFAEEYDQVPEGATFALLDGRTVVATGTAHWTTFFQRTPPEIDLRGIEETKSVHAVIAEQLGWPVLPGSWNGLIERALDGEWLPDEIVLRGFDELERTRPQDAKDLLHFFERYNDEGHGCIVGVTDDYVTDHLYYLSYEARPTAQAHVEDVIGAVIKCWIKAESAREAHHIATAGIREAGWKVESQTEVGPVRVDLTQEGESSPVRQACFEGAVYSFHTWSANEPEPSPGS